RSIAQQTIPKNKRRIELSANFFSAVKKIRIIPDMAGLQSNEKETSSSVTISHPTFTDLNMHEVVLIEEKSLTIKETRCIKVKRNILSSFKNANTGKAYPKISEVEGPEGPNK
ncbi:hypothetical protein Salat_0196200, partial [Sesamum alatum]